jgi:hypothetical protein
MIPSVAARAARRLSEIGASDCEELGDGWLVQPVNALSSFAYVVVGAIVVGQALRRGRATIDTWVFGALLAAIGLGSVAFHGPQPTGARLMHDLPILLTVIYVAACDVAVVRASPVLRWQVFVPVGAVAAAVMAVSVDAGIVLTGLGVAAIAVLEVVIHRRRLRDLDDRTRRRSAAVVIAVTAVAAATWLLGRTDSPACDPDGVLQFHGVWHLLSAMVFWLWWYVSTTGDVTRVDRPTVSSSLR